MTLPTQERPDPDHIPSLRHRDPRMDPYELTEEDRRILAKVRPIYDACRHKGSHTSGRLKTDAAGVLIGPCANELLAEHGVEWSPGNARWYAFETALREGLEKGDWHPYV